MRREGRGGPPHHAKSQHSSSTILLTHFAGCFHVKRRGAIRIPGAHGASEGTIEYMVRQLEAVFENGVLRPLEPLLLVESQRVRITISDEPPANPLLDLTVLL